MNAWAALVAAEMARAEGELRAAARDVGRRPCGAGVARLRAIAAEDPAVLAARMPLAGDIGAAQAQVRELLAQVDALQPEAVAR